jgi:hypothetical protein
MSIFKSGMLPSIGRRVLDQSKVTDDQDELALTKRFEAIDLIHREFSDIYFGSAVVDSRDRSSNKEHGVKHRV